jgi:drug/metabolite transporter (DMT)-like permease
MLRGSIVIFTAVLTVTYRKRRLYSSGWTGVMVVALALVVVAASAFGTTDDSTSLDDLLSSSSLASSSQEGESNVIELIAGIALVIAAQFLQAAQTIIEEKLLHDVKVR